MILCWNEGQSSTIHDHADSHCFMKVLKGGLTEIKYSWPQEALIASLEPSCVSSSQKDEENFEQELQEISRSSMNTNEVFYINGESLIRKVIKSFLFFWFAWQTILACIESRTRVMSKLLSVCTYIVRHLTAAQFSTRPGKELNAR